jgi:glycosyltransferase involved in cell wall biosynthesis
MNILNISQILPIPGIYKTNDFVFTQTDYALSQGSIDSACFIRPVPYTNAFLEKYLQTTSIALPPDLREYRFNHYSIKVCRFLSAWRKNNLHALLTPSIYWFNRKAITKLVKQNHIDVIHAQFIFPDGALALMLKRRYKIPYVITTHTELKYFNSLLSGKIATKILKNAFKVIPLNYSNIEFFKQLGLRNLELIPLGIDNHFFQVPQDKRSKSEFRMVTMCNLIKLKNIDQVLYAVSALRDKYNIHYTVLGQGPEEENLRKLCEQLGISNLVEFCGFKPHASLPQILKQHDLFILPSYPETFGRSYFEAMAAGLPVICAKKSGIYGYFPDLVDRFAVNPCDPNDSKDKIEWFVNHRESCMEIGKELQCRVSSYTWEKITHRLREIYAEASRSETYSTKERTTEMLLMSSD